MDGRTLHAVIILDYNHLNCVDLQVLRSITTSSVQPNIVQTHVIIC